MHPIKPGQYRTGWHDSTPGRCKGYGTNPNGSTVPCNHPSHAQDSARVTVDAQAE
jgi:hypothetical protein